MPAAKFVKGGTTLTFTRNPRRPSLALGMLQPVAATAAGKVLAQDDLANEQRIVLTWPHMAAADLTSLRAFYESTVKGAAESFTYTNTAGESQTVRFAPEGLTATDAAPGSYAVTLTLLEA